MTISVCWQDTNIEAQLWIVRGVCAEPEAGSQGKPGWTFEAACVALARRCACPCGGAAACDGDDAKLGAAPSREGGAYSSES